MFSLALGSLGRGEAEYTEYSACNCTYGWPCIYSCSCSYSCTMQVAILLYLCQMLVYSMWSRGTDPDNAAIPYLTAVCTQIIMDLLDLWRPCMTSPDIP